MRVTEEEYAELMQRHSVPGMNGRSPRALRRNEAFGIGITPEGWQTQMIDLAHALGWTVAHFRPAMTMKGMRTAVGADGKGYPDLTLAHPKQCRVIWAELKTGSGRLSPEQKQWLEVLQQAGQEAYLWRETQYDEVAAILRGGQMMVGESGGLVERIAELERELFQVQLHANVLVREKQELQERASQAERGKRLADNRLNAVGLLIEVEDCVPADFWGRVDKLAEELFTQIMAPPVIIAENEEADSVDNG